jgi:hypothetical protein
MKKLLVLVLGIIVLNSCKDDHDHDHENELITTVKLDFTENGNTKSFMYKDLDGDGGMAPVIDRISLKPNTEYSLKVNFLDESKSPASDITQEIKEEGAEHLLVFTVNPSAAATYTYNDKDVNGLNLGLDGKFKTNAAQNGTLKVQLRHQAPVGGKRTKDGSPAPGSDDANVTFTLEIK